jgi:peroxiredoxin
MAAETPVCDFGWKAVDFDLPGVDGRRYDLAAARGENGLLVMFICNHCPYVRHVADEIARLGRDYRDRDVAIVAINSNDVAQQPGDDPVAMKAFAAERGFVFPYLYDESQAVAAEYHAACTPDFFLFDADRRLVYRGQLDGSRPSNDVPIDGRDLRAALDATLAGEPVPDPQLPSLGCNIKWKPGREPQRASLGQA